MPFGEISERFRPLPFRADIGCVQNMIAPKWATVQDPSLDTGGCEVGLPTAGLLRALGSFIAYEVHARDRENERRDYVYGNTVARQRSEKSGEVPHCLAQKMIEYDRE